MTNDGTDSSSNDYDYLFKIVLIGDPGVGKSNILSRIHRNDFNVNYQETDIVEFAQKIFEVQPDGKRVKAQIWDRGGSKKYQSAGFQYYRGAVGVIVVYSITDRASFENATTYWLEELSQFKKSQDDVYRLLVGNKIDLNDKRSVSIDEARQFAENNGLSFIETSALNLNNIDNLFQDVVNGIYNNAKVVKRHHSTY
ncbi:Gtp-bound Rab11 in complex with Fip3 [Phascolomyces articulosus]|uniref:Gtp-bound Rab11 in complex with Fip3 n=1 Tax=Phascolomyces articulosus TaxID=60185 RepID=A0AAD5PCW0_9FUNG|nr:Gtp-bound Rab11 in complex with Fip3 [Phascolomyces articulosus]